MLAIWICFIGFWYIIRFWNVIMTLPTTKLPRFCLRFGLKRPSHVYLMKHTFRKLKYSSCIGSLRFISNVKDRYKLMIGLKTSFYQHIELESFVIAYLYWNWEKLAGNNIKKTVNNITNRSLFASYFLRISNLRISYLLKLNWVRLDH